MRNIRSGYINGLVLLMIALTAVYSCGNRLNERQGTVSSQSAKIVTCPTTTVTAVSISGSSFQSASVSVSVNDIVQWTNNDPITHTVTSGTPGTPDGKFDSGNLMPGTKVCVQFLAAGSYSYYCSIHPFMTGIVTVQ